MLYLSLFFITVALCAVVRAAPANLGVKFEERSTLPTLNLPYGTWKASSYNAISDM